MRKRRPWLQDFTLPDMAESGAREPLARIDAAGSPASGGGWMVWDLAKEYHAAEFAPADRARDAQRLIHDPTRGWGADRQPGRGPAAFG